MSNDDLTFFYVKVNFTFYNLKASPAYLPLEVDLVTNVSSDQSLLKDSDIKAIKIQSLELLQLNLKEENQEDLLKYIENATYATVTITPSFIGMGSSDDFYNKPASAKSNLAQTDPKEDSKEDVSK